ncbi:MAG: hypothetical protein PUB46_06975 [Lachnospiraceae bacterium]|nr:hypothetical protein [Lachnospiraceae bacterium]
MEGFNINGKILIGIDHGYGNMKTRHTVFKSGVKCYASEPAIASNMLEYDGKYYVIGESHKVFIANKNEDDDYYILTLAAIAKELAFRNISTADVLLAVGLPHVYGVGMVDVEFSMDVYSNPQEPDGVVMSSRDDTLEPAIEIVLHEEPREIERSTDENLVFRDFKPYLQIGRHFSVVNREDWSYESYEYRNDISEKYDNMYVYGIGMEDNPAIEELLKEKEYDTCLKKRMVIVLSDKSREG